MKIIPGTKVADNNNKPSSSVANNKMVTISGGKKSELNKNNDLETQPREPRTNDDYSNMMHMRIQIQQRNQLKLSTRQ